MPQLLHKLMQEASSSRFWCFFIEKRHVDFQQLAATRGLPTAMIENIHRHVHRNFIVVVAEPSNKPDTINRLYSELVGKNLVKARMEEAALQAEREQQVRLTGVLTSNPGSGLAARVPPLVREFGFAQRVYSSAKLSHMVFGLRHVGRCCLHMRALSCIGVSRWFRLRRCHRLHA